MVDFYLYGMVLVTTSFRLAQAYPQPDGYAEIRQMYEQPGGETGTCAFVLDSLGASCVLEGNYMGARTHPAFTALCAGRRIDTSRLVKDETYDGLQDYVIIDDDSRTVMGTFNRFFSDGSERWQQPCEEALCAARFAGIDPFIEKCADTAARMAVKNGRRYVTIDCMPDTYLAQNADVIAVSNEFISGHFPNKDREELLKAYARACKGLVIFTLGAKKVLYARGESGVHAFMPYAVKAESTLGAGDTFKAGCLYALMKGMTDEETVSFACACAGAACMAYPLFLNLPTLESISRLQQSR